jgi:hypothetical protein
MASVVPVEGHFVAGHPVEGAKGIVGASTGLRGGRGSWRCERLDVNRSRSGNRQGHNAPGLGSFHGNTNGNALKTRLSEKSARIVKKVIDER